MAKIRIDRELKNATLTDTSIELDPVDKVLLWRERIVSNRIGEWM